MIKHNLSKSLLLIISLIGGGLWWFMLIQSHYREVVVEVPICFYNVASQSDIQANSSVRVTLAGKRTDIFLQPINDLALHVNAELLHKEGRHEISLNDCTQMFLRKGVKMIHCTPDHITVTVNPFSSSEHDNECNNERNNNAPYAPSNGTSLIDL